MMRKGGETPEEEKERFEVIARVRQARQGDPRRRARHRLRARRPGDLPDVACSSCKPFGKVVICGATSGYNLDFDVRYLWMRQKQIIGSHFANAWEATKANELIAQSKIRPVLWRVMPFEGVAEAHQLMRENKHQGKIAILVGADGRPGQDRRGPRRDPRRGRQLSDGGVARARASGRASEAAQLMDAVQLDYIVTPFRAQRFVDLYRPASRRPLDVRREQLPLLPLRGGPGPLRAHVVLGGPRRLRALLVLARDAGHPRRRSPGCTTSRCCRTGTRPRARLRGSSGSAQPRSSGAIVSPASLSCSQ